MYYTKAFGYDFGFKRPTIADAVDKHEGLKLVEYGHYPQGYLVVLKSTVTTSKASHCLIPVPVEDDQWLLGEEFYGYLYDVGITEELPEALTWHVVIHP